jgi:sporulation protein YlmC with PRC-barrel domain
MAHSRKWIELAGAVAAALSAVAFAQPPEAQPSETYKPNRQPDQRPERAKGQMKAVELVPCEWIDGATVRSPNDDKLGEVKDLILSREARRITFALVGHGGVLTVGEKVTAVPFRALDWNADKKTLNLSMTKEQFDAAPTLDSGDWKTLNDPARVEPIYSHFNCPDDRAINGEPATLPEGTPRLSATEHPVVRVSDIRGKTLVGSDGREVGKVDDLVVDTSSGRVAFVAVTFGGVIGIGKDRVAVPWSAFDINKDGRLFVTNIDKEMINSAPRMTQKEWGELRDPAFGANVYKHYGQKAHWLDAGAGEMTPAMREYRRIYTSGTPRDISGTVESVDEQTPMTGVPTVMVLTVKSTGNDTVTVHTCPKSDLDGRHIQVRKGDSVVIKGREATIDGKKVLIATQITTGDGRPVTIREDRD